MEARKPEVLCIGFGALGTIYSLLLSRGGASITAVARSNYTTLTTTGIDIASAKYGDIPNWKPDRCVRESEPDTAQDRYYDYVLCTFKNVPDHKRASEIIRPFLKAPCGEEQKLPTIVLLQNGVGIEEEVSKALVEGEERLASGIISAVAWIGANLVDGGKKVTHGALERLQMGTYPIQANEQQKAALVEFTRIYTNGGGGGTAVQDIETIRWQKVLWNAAWGGLSTLARQPVSALLDEETLHYSIGVVRRIMLEIVYVARACGISEERFPMASVDQAVNITVATSPVAAVNDASKGGNLAAHFKPSILLDLENGRPMELEPIIGNVVARAREHDVDTPRLDLILAALKPNQVDAIRRADGDRVEKRGVSTTFSQLTATSRGNWPAGAPVSKDSRTYL
ncbi:uncharacterized protein UMAG_00283 [Mycosarcoma maydis]|uniref:2-dehydropantoate 2-reductase n=1 Tax=Mycosarcoma maydis TaxID=5270 RepID=A0A0D1EBX2_MYCMD|nr:uncharacterized protein UMAG_00283 [Ustilago maydis 521]KIS71855.1 hypothetical protein UMAG_00283 [Ustilago maydis 521]|eukprot:XP_011386198.1 hypothetical protein UMAG_00283 [Ustilago maydis 521]